MIMDGNIQGSDWSDTEPDYSSDEDIPPEERKKKKRKDKK